MLLTAAVKPKNAFQLSRERAARVNAYNLSNQLKWLKALNARGGRKQRRGIRIRRLVRWWWRRPLKRRIRRSRIQFANLTRRQNWRLARRDVFVVKRSRRYYTTKFSALGATALVQQKYRGSRAFTRRSARNVVHKQTTKHSSRLHSSAAYLRSALRRLIRREKTCALNLGAFGRDLPQVNTRLDVRMRELRQSRGSRFTALSAPTTVTYPEVVTGGAGVAQPKFVDSRRLEKAKHFRGWALTRTLQKLNTQRQLRAAAVSVKSQPGARGLSGPASAQLLLQLRGYYLSAGDTRLSVARNTNSPILPFLQVTPPAGATDTRTTTPFTAQQRSSAFLLRSALSKGVSYPQRAGFLTQFTGKVQGNRYVLRSLRAEAVLAQEQRRYRAAQIRHRRVKMRLPNTTLTRRRRRKSGLVAFVGNALKRPRTLAGRKHVLLPPVNTFNAAATVSGAGHTPTARTVMAYDRREDTLPIF